MNILLMDNAPADRKSCLFLELLGIDAKPGVKFKTDIVDEIEERYFSLCDRCSFVPILKEYHWRFGSFCLFLYPGLSDYNHYPGFPEQVVKSWRFWGYLDVVSKYSSVDVHVLRVHVCHKDELDSLVGHVSSLFLAFDQHLKKGVKE